MLQNYTRAKRLLLVAVLSAPLWACPSLSTMQTVRTVPRGGFRFGFGGGMYGVAASAGGAAAAATVPQVEFAGRYGLTDEMDVGAKLGLGGFELGLKYQFIRGGFDVALAPSASLLYFSSGTGVGSSSVGFLHVHLPLLMGANLGDSATVAFGPRLLYWLNFVTASSGGSGASFGNDGLWAGGFVGFPLKVGDAFWIAPEFSVITNIVLTGAATAGGATGTGSVNPFSVFLYQVGLGLHFGGPEGQGDSGGFQQAAPMPPPAQYEEAPSPY